MDVVLKRGRGRPHKHLTGDALHQRTKRLVERMRRAARHTEQEIELAILLRELEELTNLARQRLANHQLVRRGVKSRARIIKYILNRSVNYERPTR